MHYNINVYMALSLQSSPVVSRNVPPVSEAVQWARQLLRRVEEPMMVFRNNTVVMQSMVRIRHYACTYGNMEMNCTVIAWYPLSICMNRYVTQLITILLVVKWSQEVVVQL